MTRNPRLAGSLAVIACYLYLSSVSAQVPQSVLDRDAHLSQLAAETAMRGPVTPVPLLGEGTRPLGALYDQYLLGVLIARQQIAGGQQVDPAAIVAHPLWKSRGTVIVAYPIDCDGHANHPLAIRWIMAASAPVGATPIGEPVRGNAAQSLLPGVALPDDALVVNLRNALLTSASVEVDYADPVCHGGARTTRLPLAMVPSIALARGFNGIKLPNDFASLPSPTTVHMQVMLDPTGHPRFVEQMDGPPELKPLILELVNARTYPPATANGVSWPMSLIVPFVFTTSGEAATPAPYRPVPTPGVTRTTSAAVAVAVPSTTPPPVLPPAPPGLIDTNLARLAIEVAQKSDPVPVPLDTAGPVVHGVFFDSFLVALTKARQAVLAGRAIDPSSATAEMIREDAVAVAYPLTCNGRTIQAGDVTMSVGGTRPGSLAERSPVLTGPDLAARLPGVRLPEGAIGKAFANPFFSQNVEVRITYGEPPCGADTKTVALQIQWVRGTSISRMSFAKLPGDSKLPSPLAVEMRGLVDLDGAYRFPSMADGPTELGPLAVATAKDWRYQPYRANGVAMPQHILAPLTFTTTGAPDQGMPSDPASATAPGTSAAPPPTIMTSSTIGGRAETLTTQEAPGLSARSSLCAIAPTSTYGFASAAPIKTGGGVMGGSARERQYLGVLRGPAGQGLTITRRGATMGPDGSTVLDVYAVAYEGLAAPLLLYLDEYHDGVLQAPQGLVCAAAIVVR